jgi:hypothetical protein
MKKIADIRHPVWLSCLEDWTKWRLTYASGAEFIRRYLKKYSLREDAQDFIDRTFITYCPAFAKAALNDIKNSIFQRMNEIKRNDGSKSYVDAINGKNGGVDLKGSSMDVFVGQQILPELLSIGKVGIYVDAPEVSGITLAQTYNKRPYLYYYTAEDIVGWKTDSVDPQSLLNVLLREEVFTYDESTGLPDGSYCRYRHISKTEAGILIKFYNEDSEQIDINGIPSAQEYLLNLPRIPFHIAELSDSLLRDIADYQIALLNMASSDIHYILKANFPFYVEQFDVRSQNPYAKKSDPEDTDKNASNESKVGTSTGRRYPMNTNQPAFIHPSSEPLLASMKKQEQVKQEMSQLLNLALTNVQPKFASAESKQMDSKSLENGLAYIGLELERVENLVAQTWAAYEKGKPATIKYPEKYNLISPTDKQDEIEGNNKLILKLPSRTAQKELMKRNAELSLSHKLPNEKMESIYSEIDKLEYISSDPVELQMDIEMGLVTAKLASQARGYPDGQAELAKAEHAAKLAEIAKAQGQQLKQTQGDPKAPQKAKKLDSKNPLKKQEKRGDGKVQQ